MSYEAILDLHFPSWANMIDLAISQLDGREDVLQTWKVCPYEHSYDMCE